MPHPILQHHPTRHKIIVANWLRPMIEFITKAQNLESPSQSSLYLVRPQQQQHTNKPLIIVPRSLNMVAWNTAIFNDIKPPWQNNDKQLFSSSCLALFFLWMLQVEVVQHHSILDGLFLQQVAKEQTPLFHTYVQTTYNSEKARNMKSVSQAKLPYFEGIFKL